MKGHMKDGKFHPHTEYKKGTRKSREQNKKSEGVKIRKKIGIGENPQGTPNINKFIDKGGEGLRGTLVARTKNGKRGIILAQNSAFAKGGASWGKLYEVVEKSPKEYPVVKKEVKKIPDTKEWEILSLATTRLKRSVKQNLKSIEPYIRQSAVRKTNYSTKDDYGQFEHLPVDVAESLLTGVPNIDPNETQNNSPKAKELVALAKKHDGNLGGYFINATDKRRDDHRIQLETVYLQMTRKEADALAEKISPDEFDKMKDGTWRFWWD